jgi:hypothetical protein
MEEIMMSYQLEGSNIRITTDILTRRTKAELINRSTGEVVDEVEWEDESVLRFAQWIIDRQD